MTENERWKKWLDNEMSKDYFLNIEKKFECLNQKVELSPIREYWYNSILNIDDINNIKVIITGNKPYYESYAADGYAYSSNDDIDIEMGLLYKKIYQDLGITYNQDDNTKKRWLDQGILCFPMQFTTISGNKKSSFDDWLPFTSKVINYLICDKRPKAFIFLDRYTKRIPHFLWNKKSLPHLFIQQDINYINFNTEPIFSKVNDFIKNIYNYEIKWQ